MTSGSLGRRGSSFLLGALDGYAVSFPIEVPGQSGQPQATGSLRPEFRPDEVARIGSPRFLAYTVRAS
jgi:hypothetical protein